MIWATVRVKTSAPMRAACRTTSRSEATPTTVPPSSTMTAPTLCSASVASRASTVSDGAALTTPGSRPACLWPSVSAIFTAFTSQGFGVDPAASFPQ